MNFLQLSCVYNELKEFREALNSPVFSEEDFQGEDVFIQITSKEGFRGHYRVALTLDLDMKDSALEIRSILLRDVEKKLEDVAEKLKAKTTQGES